MRKVRSLLSALAIFILCLNFNGVSSAHQIADAQSSAVAASLLRWSSAPDQPDAALQQILQQSVKDLPGDWAIAVKKLDTGQMAEVNPSKQFVAASLYKLDVLLTLATLHAQGELNYTDWITTTLDDDAEDYSNGDPGIDPGTLLSVQRAAELMIDESNNTAAAMLIRTVGGQDAINNVLQDYGLNHTLFDPANDNLTSADDMMRYFEMLYSARLVSADESKWMLDILLRQELNYLIPNNLPSSVPVAHKTGNLDYLFHDAGIVYAPSGAFAIVVLAENLDTEDTARAQTPIIAQAVYDYFNQNNYQPSRTFPQTGHTVSGPFLKFWNTWGGLAQFGYPLTDAIKENGMQVQYFERARFEWHPDDSSNPIQLTLLGSELASVRGYPTAAAQPSNGDSTQYFSATGHNVSKSFLTYWGNHGGLTVFGYPITERFTEVSAINGKKYTVQYFQRARFELHDEGSSDSYVLLGPLGSETMQLHHQALQQSTMDSLFDQVTRIGSI